MENEGKLRATQKDEKEVKKKRGIPKKEVKEKSTEAVYLRKFLSKKEGADFKIEFRKRREMERLPAQMRTRSNGKSESSGTNDGYEKREQGR